MIILIKNDQPTEMGGGVLDKEAHWRVKASRLQVRTKHVYMRTVAFSCFQNVTTYAPS